MIRKLLFIALILFAPAAADEPVLSVHQEGLELVVTLSNPGPAELAYETVDFGDLKHIAIGVYNETNYHVAPNPRCGTHLKDGVAKLAAGQSISRRFKCWELTQRNPHQPREVQARLAVFRGGKSYELRSPKFDWSHPPRPWDCMDFVEE